ncbi:MAG: Rieske 2Fe-2S domain-containing protein [Acidobacteriota bacterium]|nr:Rieske 2Fe-2S domain-containing protein [Acidobacteriota bacterium]
MAEHPPRWREDFPIAWERDQYLTRRELAKFLTLGSGLFAAATLVIAAAGRRFRVPVYPRVRIARVAELPVRGVLPFRYPTAEDPCLLLRRPDGTLVAYSQVCTHLSCAVVYEPADNVLFCPCHHGSFSTAGGEPVAGPPRRPLPRIRIEQDGEDIFATGVEV